MTPDFSNELRELLELTNLGVMLQGSVTTRQLEQRGINLAALDRIARRSSYRVAYSDAGARLIPAPYGGH